MGAHQDLVQGAVVLTLAVVCALLNGAFDALVGIAVHIVFLLFIGFCNSMATDTEIMQTEIFAFDCFSKKDMV